MLCVWCAEHTQLISNTHHAPTPSTDYSCICKRALKLAKGAREESGPKTPPPTPLPADYRSTAVQARPHIAHIGPDTRCGSGRRQRSLVSGGCSTNPVMCKRSECWGRHTYSKISLKICRSRKTGNIFQRFAFVSEYVKILPRFTLGLIDSTLM